MFKIFSASPWPANRRPSFEPTQPLPPTAVPQPRPGRAGRPQARFACDEIERAWSDTNLDDEGGPDAR